MCGFVTQQRGPLDKRLIDYRRSGSTDLSVTVGCPQEILKSKG